jgi:hypothetical protein
MTAPNDWRRATYGGSAGAVGLGAALLVAAWRPDARLVILVPLCVIVPLILMGVGPRACDTPKRRWTFACCEAFVTVYGPLVVAAINTWLFDGHNSWLRAEFWKYLAIFPGSMLVELVSVSFWGRHPGLPPTILFVVATLLSAVMLTAAAWPAARMWRTRWVLTPLIGGLNAYCALFLDAAMRM